LNTLDADEHRAVEEHLRRDADDSERVERLRVALAPLAADVDDDAPPRGLVVATIARVAAHHCRKLPPAPPEPPTLEMPLRHGWRWVDNLIAAGILLCALTLVPTLATRLWHQYHVYSCANNLHKFHNALMQYSDTHGDALP